MIYRHHYTLREALKLLDPKNAPADTSDLASLKTSSGPTWDFNTGYEKAFHLAQVGWQEKAAILRADTLKFAASEAKPPNTYYDVSGASVDIGLFLDGEPECMLNFDEEQVSKSVRIWVMISAQCHLSATVLYNRGLAISSLIYSLMTAGHSISLDVINAVSGSSESNIHINQITVSTFGEFLEPAKIAFWIAHPAALRRCIFRLNEHSSDTERSEFGFYDARGYGFPCDLPEKEIPQGVIYIPVIQESHKFGSKDDARKTVIGIAEKVGFQII